MLDIELTAMYAREIHRDRQAEAEALARANLGNAPPRPLRALLAPLLRRLSRPARDHRGKAAHLTPARR